MDKFKKKLFGIKLEVYVFLSIAIIVIYSIAEFVCGCFGYSHDTLTVSLYGFFGGEIVSCALIKIYKLKETNENVD